MSGSDDKMKAEFDTVATWTADAALELGPGSYLAAGCRGSASPAMLSWLLDRLDVGAGATLLDVGAGVGGPAAFAAAETQVRPVLTDPEEGACRAAARLFGLPTVQAADALPFADGAVDFGWSLGVLCTVPDHDGFLRELHRVLGPAGRLGLLVFLTTDPARSDRLEGNHFPTGDALDGLLAATGWHVMDSTPTSVVDEAPPDWEAATTEVERVLERDHGADPAWTMAAEQATAIGHLLSTGAVVGRLIVAEPRPPEGP